MGTQVVFTGYLFAALVPQVLLDTCALAEDAPNKATTVQAKGRIQGAFRWADDPVEGDMRMVFQVAVTMRADEPSGRDFIRPSSAVS